MASKKTKAAPTDDELNKLLEGIGEDESTPRPGPKGQAKKTAAVASQSEQDLLDELENLGTQKTSSRPHTPRISTSGKRATATPPSNGVASSEEKLPASRRSVESTPSANTSVTPSASSSEHQDGDRKVAGAQSVDELPEQVAQSSGGGWWEGLLATASAAVKTAEAAMKEIQQNEEAQRWAEQVKGNVGVLRGFGGELRSRALPTFTNILHTLVPPISSHERLQIHITHDFIGYPSLDPLIYATFSRVMAQVEGGDLLVIQRGQELTARRGSVVKGYSGGGGGWSDGPWWRQSDEHRDLGSVKGLVEGTKLVRVTAETYANEYFTSHGGLEAATQRATEELSVTNPVRSSDIFLAIQAISHEATTDHFQSGSKVKEVSAVVEDPEKPDELITFAIYLHDPVHSITLHTISQSVPAKWIRWLDSPSQQSAAAAADGTPAPMPEDLYQSNHHLPAEIAEIVENGGVDPREWVSEWVEETLILGTGIVAQRYVAIRMGVGDGGIGRGKAPMAEVLNDGGGEAARAGVF